MSKGKPFSNHHFSRAILVFRAFKKQQFLKKTLANRNGTAKSLYARRQPLWVFGEMGFERCCTIGLPGSRGCPQAIFVMTELTHSKLTIIWVFHAPSRMQSLVESETVKKPRWQIISQPKFDLWDFFASIMLWKSNYHFYRFVCEDHFFMVRVHHNPKRTAIFYMVFVSQTNSILRLPVINTHLTPQSLRSLLGIDYLFFDRSCIRKKLILV